MLKTITTNQQVYIICMYTQYACSYKTNNDDKLLWDCKQNLIIIATTVIQCHDSKLKITYYQNHYGNYRSESHLIDLITELHSLIQTWLIAWSHSLVFTWFLWLWCRMLWPGSIKGRFLMSCSRGDVSQWISLPINRPPPSAGDSDAFTVGLSQSVQALVTVN